MKAAIDRALPPLAFLKLVTFLDEAERFGLDWHSLVQDAGIDPVFLKNPQNVTSERFGMLLTLLAEQLPAEFSVNMGLSWDFTKFGLIGYTLLNSRECGRFIDRCTDYIQRFAHMAAASRVNEKDWAIEYNVRPEMSGLAARMCVEEACGATFAIWQKLTQAPLSAVAIEFAHASPERDRIIEDRLKTTVISGCARNRLVLKRADRTLPITIREADTLRLCERSCAGILSELIAAPFPFLQLREIFLLSCGHCPALGEAAAKLGMSKRSLNRLLMAAGEQYRNISRRYRADYAMALLRSHELCVKEIAFALGFSSPASFRRTFFDWTGKTVGDWTHTEIGQLPPRK